MTQCAWSLDLRVLSPGSLSLTALSLRASGSAVQVSTPDMNVNVTGNTLLTSFSRFSAADTSTRLALSCGGNITLQTSVLSAGTLSVTTPQQINVATQTYVRFGSRMTIKAGSLLTISGTVSQIDLPPGPTTLVAYAGNCTCGSDADVIANSIVLLVPGKLTVFGLVNALPTQFASKSTLCPPVSGQPALPAVDVTTSCTDNPLELPSAGGFTVWMSVKTLYVLQGGQVSGGTIRVCSYSVRIAPTGAISAQGLGCDSGTGQGAGYAAVQGPSSGAGHGGFGGDGITSEGEITAGGAPYDNVTSPSMFGSGGGDTNLGGQGGGIIYCESAAVDLEGQIVGSGFPGNPAVLPSGYGGGGGSGGSHVLVTANLTGVGTLDFSGGAGGAPSGGGGSGGLISVVWLDGEAPAQQAALSGMRSWYECVERAWNDAFGSRQGLNGRRRTWSAATLVQSLERMHDGSSMRGVELSGTTPWSSCAAAAGMYADLPPARLSAVIQPLVSADSVADAASLSLVVRLRAASGDDFQGQLLNGGGQGASPGDSGDHGLSESIPSCDEGQGGALCLDCMPGTFKPYAGNNLPCMLCDPGFATNGTGSTACTACNSTSVAPLPGAAECSVCPPSFLPDANRTSCAFCAAGHGGSECLPCAPGSFNNDSTTAPCHPCLPGFAQEEEGQANCIACPVMTFANDTGSLTCRACPQGGVSGNASASCMMCGAGSYADAFTATCEACPANTYSDRPVDQCLDCGDGSWSLGNASRCFICPPKPAHSTWLPNNKSQPDPAPQPDTWLRRILGSSDALPMGSYSPVHLSEMAARDEGPAGSSGSDSDSDSDSDGGSSAAWLYGYGAKSGSIGSGTPQVCAFACDAGFVDYPHCIEPVLVPYIMLHQWQGLGGIAAGLAAATLLLGYTYRSFRPARRAAVDYSWVPDAEMQGRDDACCGGGCCTGASGAGGSDKLALSVEAYWGNMSYDVVLRAPTRHSCGWLRVLCGYICPGSSGHAAGAGHAAAYHAVGNAMGDAAAYDALGDSVSEPASPHASRTPGPGRAARGPRGFTGGRYTGTGRKSAVPVQIPVPGSASSSAPRPIAQGPGGREAFDPTAAAAHVGGGGLDDDRDRPHRGSSPGFSLPPLSSSLPGTAGVGSYGAGGSGFHGGPTLGPGGLIGFSPANAALGPLAHAHVPYSSRADGSVAGSSVGGAAAGGGALAAAARYGSATRAGRPGPGSGMAGGGDASPRFNAMRSPQGQGAGLLGRGGVHTFGSPAGVGGADVATGGSLGIGEGGGVLLAPAAAATFLSNSRSRSGTATGSVLENLVTHGVGASGNGAMGMSGAGVGSGMGMGMAGHPGAPTPTGTATDAADGAGSAGAGAAAGRGAKSLSLPPADLPRHAYRLYFRGANTPWDPLRLSPRLPAQLAPLLYETEFSQHAAEVNALARWRSWEVFIANALRLIAVSYSRSSFCRSHLSELRAMLSSLPLPFFSTLPP